MNGKKLGGWMLAGTMALFALSAQPAAATGVLAGAADLTFAGCPIGSDKAKMAGAEDGGVWTIVVEDHHQDICSPIADAQVYTGTWDTAVGHNFTSMADCLSGFTGGILCLGPVPTTATPTTAAVFICMPIALCMDGTATLVRG